MAEWALVFAGLLYAGSEEAGRPDGVELAETGPGVVGLVGAGLDVVEQEA
ncbi:MAG: hypothetical protein KAR11_09165 [Phycisphaerae bacterium]|nr:hypothetical protein [Phycisphaerae bacterium]